MSDSAVKESAPTKADPPPRPKLRGWRRGLRWFMRGILALLVIALLIVVATALVLRTDYPRRIIIDQLQKSLGLRVESATVEIDWTGHTTLRNVKISLPLAEQSFLDVPQLDAVHTSLPMIVLTRDVKLIAVTFHQPTIQVIQDNAGHWNVADAIDLITRAGGKEQADQSSKPSSVSLPAVTVEDGILHLIDRQQRSTTIQPLEVRGQPDGPLVWRYDAHVNDQLKITGQVSPGGLWEHEFSFSAGKIEPWLAAWLKNAPKIQTAGQWRGRVDGPNVSGRVRFDQLSVGSFSGQGVATVQRDAGSVVTILPEDIVIQTRNVLAPQARVRSGSVQLSGTTITAAALSIGINGGEAKVNGNFSWDDDSASFDASWHDIAIPQEMKQQGSITAKLSMPWPGAPHIEAHVQTLGAASAGAWEGKFDLTGDGRAWNDIDWTAKIAQAGWQGKQSLTINDLVATITQREHLIKLQNLSVTKGGSIDATGQLNLDDESWALNLNGQNFSAGPVSDQPVQIEIHANGKGPSATLHDLSVHSGDIEVHADGAYDARLPKPVILNISLTHLPALEGTSTTALVRGRVRGEMNLSGTMAQLGIVKGALFGSNVFVKERRIGDVAVEIGGTIWPDHAEIQTTEAQILGGTWKLNAVWPDEESGVDHGAGGNGDNGIRLRVGVRELPLSDVGDLFHLKGLNGQLSGVWTIDSPLSFDHNRITAVGASEIRDVSLRQFQAQRITAQSVLKQGRVTLDPIKVEQGHSSATIHVDLALDQPTLCNIKADVAKWQVKAPGAIESAIVSAQAELSADLVKQSAVGTISSQTNFTLNEKTTGTANLQAAIDGRTINVKQLELDAFGGKARGGGVFPLDQPMTATGHLAWDKLDASKLADLIPQANGLAGLISGSAALAPSDDPRALAPLKLIATVDVDGGHFRTIQIGNATITAYLSSVRAVLDQSTLHLAGGEVNIWGRTSEHPDAGRSSQLQIDFKDLDLDQIQQAVAEKPKPVPGKLQGSVVLIGSLADRDHLFGQGTGGITESDLLNLPIINNLYGFMHIGESRLAAHGQGTVNLRLENNTLHLDDARYFNQGTEVRARVMIHDIWKLREAPIEGTAIGSAEPLRDVKLPYLADVNRIFSALQSDLTPARIQGTVGDSKVIPIPFGDIGEGMKAFVLGDVKGQE